MATPKSTTVNRGGKSQKLPKIPPKHALLSLAEMEAIEDRHLDRIAKELRDKREAPAVKPK